jgi:chemotaxis protein MotB
VSRGEERAGGGGSMKKDQPVIIIKKGGDGHGGHHGGAWKVAYADFVTAMMAFFLVLWLVSQKQEVKAAVGGYFRDPGAFETHKGDGILEGSKDGVDPSGTPTVQTPEVMQAEQEKQLLTSAADRIKGKLEEGTEFAALRDQIEMSISPEGLKIELIDKTGSSFFDSGSALLRGEAVRILSLIAVELGKLDNDLLVEGHTDSRPFGADEQYGNWELSVDRANAARRVMMREGLRPTQLKGVRGLAATQLHNVDDPADPRNRRVSIIVRSHVAAGAEKVARSIGIAPGDGAVREKAEKSEPAVKQDAIEKPDASEPREAVEKPDASEKPGAARKATEAKTPKLRAGKSQAH